MLLKIKQTCFWTVTESGSDSFPIILFLIFYQIHEFALNWRNIYLNRFDFIGKCSFIFYLKIVQSHFEFPLWTWSKLWSTLGGNKRRPKDRIDYVLKTFFPFNSPFTILRFRSGVSYLLTPNNWALKLWNKSLNVTRILIIRCMYLALYKLPPLCCLCIYLNEIPWLF